MSNLPYLLQNGAWKYLPWPTTGDPGNRRRFPWKRNGRSTRAITEFGLGRVMLGRVGSSLAPVIVTGAPLLPFGDRSRHRVAIYLDVPNMWATAKHFGLENSPTDIIEATRLLGEVCLARAYSTARAGRPVHPRVKLFQAAGFDCVQRLVRNPDHAMKDIDTWLMADYLTCVYENQADVLVLGSGDSDYLPAIRVARRLGKRTVALLYPEQPARAVGDAVDRVIRLPARVLGTASISPLQPAGLTR